MDRTTWAGRGRITIASNRRAVPRSCAMEVRTDIVGGRKDFRIKGRWHVLVDDGDLRNVDRRDI